MNRVAAQNARDRKKNYVIDLERRLAELEAKVCTIHTHTLFCQISLWNAKVFCTSHTVHFTCLVCTE